MNNFDPYNKNLDGSVPYENKLPDFDFFSPNILEYDLYSIDIFDTLLFRCVNEPKDIFYYTAEMNRHLLLDDLSSYSFMHLRRLASQKAQYICNKEVGLSDIYSAMPCSGIGDLKALEVAEIETEKKFAFINPHICSFIKYLKDNSKKVILLSDMYLSGKQISDILVSAGFDLSLVDNIFVSSDINANKKDGLAFEYIKRIYSDYIPSKILHIGDDIIRDLSSAKKSGLSAIHYHINSDFSDMEFYEKLYKRNYEIVESDLRIRQVARRLNTYNTSFERFWYDLGVMILAPFMTYFIDWIIETAEKENIVNIYSVTSEGIFFSELIERALKYKNIKKYNVKPLYTSRMALKLSIVDFSDEYDTKNQLLIMNKLTLEEFFNRFELITYFPDCLEPYRRKVINDFKSEEAVVKKITGELSKLSTIYNEKISDYENIAFQYLSENYDFNNTMIIDIGYRGTAQRGIYRLLTKKGVNCSTLINVMALSRVASPTNNILKGINYKIFCDHDKDTKYYKAIALSRVFSVFWDNLNSGEIQSTIGYEMSPKGIIPKIDKQFKDKRQIKSAKLAQEGVFSFQETFYKLGLNQYIANKLADNRVNMLRLICRLFTYPTYREAKYVSELKFDSEYVKAYPDRATEELFINPPKTVEEVFLLRHKHLWREALEVRVDNLYSLKKLLELEVCWHSSIKLKMLSILVDISKESAENVAIYGAGKNGGQLCEMLMSVGINVTCFIDKNEGLNGQTVRGIKIYPMERLEVSNIKSIVISSPKNLESMLCDIKKHFGENIKIFY